MTGSHAFQGVASDTVAEEGLELLIFLILLQIYTSTFGLWGAEDPTQGFEQAREILYQCSYIPSP